MMGESKDKLKARWPVGPEQLQKLTWQKVFFLSSVFAG
jgi:hypothetical protein